MEMLSPIRVHEEIRVAIDPQAAENVGPLDDNAQSIIELCEDAVRLGHEVHQEVCVRMQDVDGRVLAEHPTHNIVTTRGLQYIADAMKRGSAAFAAMSGMKLGKSTQTPAVGDLDVITPSVVSGAFKAFGSGYPLHASATITFQTVWIPGEATDTQLAEFAIKSATGVADAISRGTFPATDKGALATLTITVIWRFN